MAKTTAPALSFGARGAIAKTMVYSKWRGVPYVRQHVVPANPRTAAQTTVRNTFALLREMWKLAPPLVKQSWDSFAQGRPFTGMNKFVGENVRVLQSQPDMTDFIGSPGAKGGLPPTAIAVDSLAVGQITVDFTLPALPDGWAMHGAVAYAFRDQAPDDFFIGQIVAGEDVAAPMNQVVLAGLTSGQTYVVTAFLRQTKPDGVIAYSVALSDTQLVD